MVLTEFLGGQSFVLSSSSSSSSLLLLSMQSAGTADSIDSPTSAKSASTETVDAREKEETALVGEMKRGLGVKLKSASGADERLAAEVEEEVGTDAGKTLEDLRRLLKGRE